MTNKIKAILVVVISLIYIGVLIYIENGIANFNTDFYYGKDSGFSIRLIALVIFSSVIFLFRKDRVKTLMILLGIAGGLIHSIISYVIWFNLFDDNGVSFHIIAYVLILSSYFLIPYMGKKIE